MDLGAFNSHTSRPSSARERLLRKPGDQFQHAPVLDMSQNSFIQPPDEFLIDTWQLDETSWLDTFKSKYS